MTDLSAPLPTETAADATRRMLASETRARRVRTLQIALVLAAVVFCLWFTEFLNGPRMAEGLPAIGVLLGEMVPPDFSRWQAWIEPLIDTVAMSVAGTA
ncbi:MAG: phosphonate ABC transporter, permease protein PhnE, partial [Pseudomonadota bacterium]